MPWLHGLRKQMWDVVFITIKMCRYIYITIQVRIIYIVRNSYWSQKYSFLNMFQRFYWYRHSFLLVMFSMHSTNAKHVAYMFFYVCITVLYYFWIGTMPYHYGSLTGNWFYIINPAKLGRLVNIPNFIFAI